MRSSGEMFKPGDMSRRSIVIILVVTTALGLLSASAGAARLGAVPGASAAPGGRPIASNAGSPCRSIGAYYNRIVPTDPLFHLLFTCSQSIHEVTFIPGGTLGGADIEYGTVMQACGFSAAGGSTYNQYDCEAPSPIPPNTRISVLYASPETCQATGIHVALTVDNASTFTVNGTCAGQLGVSVKSLTGSPKGYRETLKCGIDGSNCEAITDATDLGPKDKGAEVAYARTAIASGATKTITVRLTSFGRSLLAKRHSLTTKVLVSGYMGSNPVLMKVLTKTVRISSKR